MSRAGDMPVILHGYLLEGSGSNLWTRSIIQSICRNGQTVHLMCQENHPELYDFITEAVVYHADGRRETILKREADYPGRCILHKPDLGHILPVYVPDKYEEFSDPRPMVNLSDREIKEYLEINRKVLTRILEEHPVRVILANHAVLMSVVAQEVAGSRGIPYAIMPHGSAIEYAVKKDKRFFTYAQRAFEGAQRIYVIGEEIRKRVLGLFPGIPGLGSKMLELNLGVDTSLFNLVEKGDRKAKLEELYGVLEGVRRGKTRLQLQTMHHELRADMSEESLLKLIRTSAAYNPKLTDADVEEKLRTVDWNHEKVILYVGRLIASKGLHSILAALPAILADEPDTRLIVVGHGPQREPLEVLIRALQHGYRDLVLKMVALGKEFEGSEEGDWTEMRLYLENLRAADRLDPYFSQAQRSLTGNRVLFTGYLTHRELCCLFPACDVAVFPSAVAEAGPLVFLEAMASGCFPIGTYFAGMAASIDAVSDALPPAVADLMKLTPQADQTVPDIISKVKRALYADSKHKAKLREVAIEKYDWQNISRKLTADLLALHT
jgi:glycosyltransferase involved in cell wall biosynthesis